MNISRRARVLAVVALIAVSATAATAVTTSVSAAPSETSRASQDTSVALVQLTGDPVATAKNVDRGNAKRVNLNGTATKSYRAQLSAQRNQFKKWLQKNAPTAQITGSFDISLNAVSVQLNGTSLATLKSAPMVIEAQYERLYYPLEATPVDPDLALVNAVAAWGGGGAAGAGAGVKVAIVDTGIEQDHACFDDQGDSDGPNNYTNNKVIVAKVFANKAASLGFDAEAVQDHGTHVAGTVACDYGTTAVVDGVTIPHTISGVAPAALLGNYNVFPGTIDNARSEDILNALDAAYADGMDIANMSLGGDAHGVQDLLTIAVNNLDRGGMVVAVSAGNEGPGFGTVGSPGSAERALTAGASSVPHQVVRSITNDLGVEVDAVLGDFGAVPAAGLNGPIVTVTDAPLGTVPELAAVSLGCGPISAAPLPGAIAVIARGVCDFSVKMRGAQDAGYAGVVVINREGGGAFVMGQNGDGLPQPTIPGVMIALEDRAAVLDPAAASVTLNAPKYVTPYGDANVMAGFSSEGPTDVDRRIKPDVVAPGVNVLSSVTGGGFAFFNGTSMASPHLAGAAAVVKSQHPAWTAEAIRSAIVNTADDGALTGLAGTHGNLPGDPNLFGAGLLDVDAAVHAKVLLDRVSVSFGQVPSGAGTSNSATINVLAGSVGSVAVVDSVGAATFGASTSGSTITVTATTAKRAATGPAWATVVIRDGSGNEVAHLRAYVLVA
jgi:subtilisin family serine protease